MIDCAVLFDLHIQPFGERVDYGSAHAVKAAGYLVSAAAEFAACVKFGKDKVHGISSGLMVDAYRDPSSVIGDSDAAVLIDRHFYHGAEAGQSLIHGIVHDLIDQMMQSPG